MKKLIRLLFIASLLISTAWSQPAQLEKRAAGHATSSLEQAKFYLDENGIVTVQITWLDSLGNQITTSNPLPVTTVGTSTSSSDGYTTIADGRKVVASAGTAVALASTTACKRVDITAEFNNTGVIVVGGATVVADLATRRGTPLYAGSTYSLMIEDLADVYIDATVSTDGVTFTYYE